MSIPEQPSSAGGRAMRDAVELLAAVLSEGELDLDRRGFYSRLAAGVARVAGMRRVLIFHFDSVTRRVEAVGSFNMDLAVFEQADISLEAAPDAARALIEDRVIEVRPPARHAIPLDFTELVGDHPLIYVPVGARGRWPGLIIAEPEADSAPLDETRREWLWTVGKTLALALVARFATYYGERAADLQQRIDLARELHEQVVQRLFGVLMALSPSGPLDDEARARCAEEVQAALHDARAAIQRPLGRAPRATTSTLAAEIERLSHQRLDFQLRIDGPLVDVPAPLEPLVQSVFAEAVRNVRKHAHARSLVVRLRQRDGILTLEVENDGVARPHKAAPPGVGLRLAALEALQAGGLLEFGERQPGRWQVRLAVPEGSP